MVSNFLALFHSASFKDLVKISKTLFRILAVFFFLPDFVLSLKKNQKLMMLCFKSSPVSCRISKDEKKKEVELQT